MTFNKWLREVDTHIRRLAGVGMYDLGDYLYRDAYDDGESAENVAHDVLDDNGWPLD